MNPCHRRPNRHERGKLSASRSTASRSRRRAGQTIIQACDLAGIYIPRLCFHPDLEPSGNCRVCTCNIDGRRSSACTMPATDGMAVESDTAELNADRRTLIEMLFVEGNHFCPSCEMSGHCELQALGYRLGLMAPTLPYLWPERELDATHPDIFIDRNRCILCSRCISASRMVDGKIGVWLRGARHPHAAERRRQAPRRDGNRSRRQGSASLPGRLHRHQAHRLPDALRQTRVRSGTDRQRYRGEAKAGQA